MLSSKLKVIPDAMEAAYNLAAKKSAKFQNAIEVAKDTEGEWTDVFLYGEILGMRPSPGFFGDEMDIPYIDPISVRDAIDRVDTDSVRLRINSPGGVYSEGSAVYSVLNDELKKFNRTKIIIDGACSSAATWLLPLCDVREISRYGMVMIHRTQTVSFGNSEDFRGLAEKLSQLDDAIISEYISLTSLTESEIVDFMSGEGTLFTAEEALKKNFVTAIVKNREVSRREVVENNSCVRLRTQAIRKLARI